MLYVNCLCTCLYLSYVCIVRLLHQHRYITVAWFCFLFPHTTVDREQLDIFRWMPKTKTVCRGHPGLGDTTVAGPVSHWNLLTPLLGNWFWYTTVTGPTLSTMGRHTTESSLHVFLARQICPGHVQNPVKSRGAHPRGCSRVLFLVEGPPFRAAAAALMGMVQTVLVSVIQFLLAGVPAREPPIYL